MSEVLYDSLPLGDLPRNSTLDGDYYSGGKEDVLDGVYYGGATEDFSDEDAAHTEDEEVPRVGFQLDPSHFRMKMRRQITIYSVI